MGDPSSRLSLIRHTALNGYAIVEHIPFGDVEPAPRLKSLSIAVGLHNLSDLFNPYFFTLLPFLLRFRQPDWSLTDTDQARRSSMWPLVREHRCQDADLRL